MASGFSTDLAYVIANVHIWTTVETDAIAASSIDNSLSSGSPVPDVELTGFAVSDALNPCYFVSRSLDSDIPFFYPGHTKSAVVAGLFPGPSAHEFLPFLDPIHSPNYAWSTTALANFESSSLPLCRKRLVLDA